MKERPTDPPRDDAASPAEALDGVWQLLDELPPASASRTLAATTVELAAASSAAGARPAGTRGVLGRVVSEWRGAAAIVAVALVAGILAGRLSQPAAARLLGDLPLVQHLDLLREAGSEKFLEAVAARDPGVPPRLVLRAGPEAAARAADACRAEIDSLAATLAVDDEARAAGSRARQEAWDALPLEDKVDLERAAREFARLSSNERRSLAAVARALVDPSRPHLREAAVVWHQWLSAVRPEDRQQIIDAGTDKRLEWIDWYASRLDGAARPGPAFRPDPRARPGGDDRGWWQRPRGPEPPFRSDRPLPPAETPAPPR